MFHVPTFLDERWTATGAAGIALVVIDGMALRDWRLIRGRWQAAHPDWVFDERLLIAEMPTITGVSRQALVSGLRPAGFGDDLGTTQREAGRWADFWANTDKRLSPDSCAYGRLRGDGAATTSMSAKVRAVVLIESGIDRLVHGSSLGSAQMQQSLTLWIATDGRQVEAEIVALLARGFLVYVASDHGHVGATGVGSVPAEALVQTRGKRARVYREESFARRTMERRPDAVLWHGDMVLPADAWVVMAPNRSSFAPAGERCVTHGGPTIDEVVVPFVGISRP